MKRVWVALFITIGLLPAAGTAQEPTPTRDEQHVLAAAQSLARAFDQFDAGAVEKLTAETFVVITQGFGVGGPREQMLGTLRRNRPAGDAPARERSWRDLTARVTGDTAVVIGQTGLKGADGATTMTTLVTTAWSRRDGAWRAVSEQRAVPRDVAEESVWNYVFSVGAGTSFNAKPNALLADAVVGVKPGRALDVGMGQGRNTIHLARLGWDVTGMDPAEVGLAIARQSALAAKVRITPVLQTAEEFAWGENQWDLIAVIYMNARGFEDRIRTSLKTGGLLVVEGFHKDATKGGPIGAGVVWESGELKALLPEFEIVRYEEPEAVADYGLNTVRLVRLVARKK